MSYSFYEVYITTLRALMSMGFPYGIDEDAAFMITWLELHKLGGIKKFVRLSKKIDKNFKANIDINDIDLKKSIDLHKVSLLMKGPNLFDYLYEKNKKFQFLETLLVNCIDPIFVIPLAKKLSNKIKIINACWLNEKNTLIGINVSKNKLLIGELENSLKLSKSQVIIQFIKLNKKNNFKYNIKLKNIYQKIDKISEQKYLEDSIKPKTTHWNIISKLAHKTFVPSSTFSRKKGAGGGDDND